MGEMPLIVMITVVGFLVVLLMLLVGFVKLIGRAFTSRPSMPQGYGGGYANQGGAMGGNSRGQDGVCFFCSQPMQIQQLLPVTINLGGNVQRVLACPQDASVVQAGGTPQIRSFNYNGQNVPWYAYPQYDPYRDYGSSSMLGNLMMLNAIDNMYWNWHRPSGWGWGGGYGGGNTYVFYPDHEEYRDHYAGSAAGYGDYSLGPSDTAGVDFMGSTSGDSGGNFGSSSYGGGNFGGGDRS